MQLGCSWRRGSGSELGLFLEPPGLPQLVWADPQFLQKVTSETQILWSCSSLLHWPTYLGQSVCVN